MIRDAVGNPLPTAYELSIEGRVILSADKIQKAFWKLAHARVKSRTKKELQKDVDEAMNLMSDALELINGRRY